LAYRAVTALSLRTAFKAPSTYSKSTQGFQQFSTFTSLPRQLNGFSTTKTQSKTIGVIPSFTYRSYSTTRVGATAPLFQADALVGTEFKSIKLSDYKGKYLVLFWYPFDFTFVCPTEITDFSDRAPDFRAINCEVVGASCDSKFTHLAWANTPRKEGGIGILNIPLIADFKKEIAASYGALYGANGFPLRATFIIDDKQNIRHISMNDPPVGRSVDEVFRLVQAFQHTDKHGEVCPAGWKPGGATMKPDPVKSKEYFQKYQEELAQAKSINLETQKEPTTKKINEIK